MKKEKVEYYTIMPNLKQLYGKKVDKNTVFDEKTEDGTVTQHFENLTLITKVKRKSEKSENNPYSYEEETTITINVPEGTILIWSEQDGFIVPQTQVCTLDDIKEQIKDIQDIYVR